MPGAPAARFACVPQAHVVSLRSETMAAPMREVCHDDEPGAVPAGAVDAELLPRYGSEAQCQAVLQSARWAAGFVCSACGAARTRFKRGGPRLPAMRRLQSAVQPDATLPGKLKTAITGTDHVFAFAKRAHRHFAGFQYRFNRRFNMNTILPCLLAALRVTPPSHGHWQRTAEVSGR